MQDWIQNYCVIFFHFSLFSFSLFLSSSLQFYSLSLPFLSSSLDLSVLVFPHFLPNCLVYYINIQLEHQLFHVPDTLNHLTGKLGNWKRNPISATWENENGGRLLKWNWDCSSSSSEIDLLPHYIWKIKQCHDEICNCLHLAIFKHLERWGSGTGNQHRGI